MSEKKIRIAIVGLGFGSEFIPIYQAHPHAEIHAICQRSREKLDRIGDTFKIEKRYADYEELLKDGEIDAVHINTPIPDHAPQSIQALKAGKHVACTVPMATRLAECEQIIKLSEETGMKYMMMETVVYSREFLFLRELYEGGELGDIQYLAASHPQDMDGWPDYWKAMVPMHYATHVVSPCLGMVNGLAEYVSCFGSGRVRADIAERSGSPFAVETCHIKLQNSDLSAHIWRFLFDVARQYRESIDVYGSKKSFEWALTEKDPHILHVAKRPEPEIPERVEVPDYGHRLPESIRKYTRSIENAEHVSFVQGGGHGGSHPHMVHEFVSSLIEDRDPWPNAKTAANWTGVGICAHESALNGGTIVRLPEWSLRALQSVNHK